jgi:acyl-CoA synthetase (NDP forming)
MALCPHTKAIALYVEAIKRGRDFIETARAIVPHKPIVAFYVGGSEAGRSASFSHTGALAGPDKLYEGVFRQAGVIRAHSIEEMFDFCWTLALCPRPANNRVIIQTHSGGPGAATADACGRAGLELSPLSPETLESLSSLVPHTGSLHNPVDLTFSKSPLDYFYNIPKVLLEERESEGLLVYFLLPTQRVEHGLESMGVPKAEVQKEAGRLIETQCQSIADLLHNQHKPLIGYSYRTRDDLFIRTLQDKGVPVLSSPERAARAMAALVQYSRLQKKLLEGKQVRSDR